MTNKEQAQSFKQQGNDAYKKKDFATAVNRFKAAIEIDHTEITFYTNLAAVHFETKVYKTFKFLVYFEAGVINESASLRYEMKPFCE